MDFIMMDILMATLIGIQYTTNNYDPATGGLPELYTHNGSYITRTFICMRYKLISSFVQYIYNH